jgi:biopolymer transport protein ExbB/TolQ
MPPDTPADARTLAAQLLKSASEQMRKQADLERVRELVRISADNARTDSPSVQLSQAQLKNLVDAVEQDLGVAADKARLDEERLTRLETQTRILARTVIAIIETTEGIAPAVGLMKAQIENPDAIP